MNESMPGEAAGSEDRAANFYDLSIYEGFPKVGEANQELQKVALSYGLHTLRTSWKDFTAWDSEGRRVVFGLSFSETSSPVSGTITSNKQLTRQFLESSHVPVPRGRTFRMSEISVALNYADQIGYPVVVKPLSGKSGVGVTAGIADMHGVRWAAGQIVGLQGERGRFVLEEHLPGHDYRIYVGYGQVLSVVLRQPASVMGDGACSVSELVEAKNRLRQHNPHTRTRLIKDDQASTYQLSQQGLTWGSIPEAGQQVELAAAANISRGGDSTEVLPETHPSILEASVKAVEAIPGLNQAGVDFLLVDHQRPLEAQAAGICEINTTPALMANQAPVYGEVQPVAQGLVRSAAEANGLTIPDPLERVRIAVRVQGTRDSQKLASWIATHALRLSLGGKIRAVGPRSVRARLQGPVDRVSALVTSMHTGNLRDRPDSVKTMPTNSRMPLKFEEADA